MGGGLEPPTHSNVRLARAGNGVKRTNLRRYMLPKISSQSARNAYSSGFVSVVQPLSQVAATPFLLHALEPDIYGIWILLTSFVMLVTVSDMGLSPTTTLFVSRERARGSQAEIERVAKTSLALYLPVTFAVLMLLTWGTGQALLFFGVSEHQVESISPALPVFAFGAAIHSLRAVPCSIIRGYERYDYDNGVQFFASFSTVLAVCGVVYFGGGLPGMLIAQALVGIAAFCLATVFSIRLVGNATWLVPYCSFVSVRQFFSLSFYGWLQAASAALFSQVDRLIVSTYLGPAALAFYSAALQIAQTFYSFLARSLGFLFPKFTALENNKEAKLKLFNRAMFITTLTGGVTAVLLFILSGPLLRFWLGANIPSELPSVLRLLAVASGFMATSIAPGTLMLGTGQFRLGAAFALFSGLSVGLAALWLVPIYGLLGAAMAKLAFLPTTLISRVFIFHHAFGCWSWSRGFRQLIPIAAAVAPPAIIYSSSSNPQTFWFLAIPAAAFGLLLMWIQCRRLYGRL